MWMIFLYKIGDLLVNPPAVSPSVEDPRNGENALSIRVSSNLFINRDINASSRRDNGCFPSQFYQNRPVAAATTVLVTAVAVLSIVELTTCRC